MSGILREILYTARTLRKSPGLSGIAVLALALGIGLTTIMFSIVHGAILKGLPFEDAQRLMHLERTNLSRDIQSMEVTIHDYLDWREQQQSFESLAAYYDGTVNLSGTERAERYEGAFMSANAFESLGVRPILGRGFREDEDESGAPAVIILGYHVWQDRFSGDEQVIDQTVQVNGEAATIIGVMPDGFRFPFLQDVWVPLRMDPLALDRGTGTTLEVYGRLNDGVSQEQATAEMQAIAQRLAAAYPETNEGVGVLMKPYADEYIGEEPRTLLFTMLGAVFLVLIIACANVANLLLARAAKRSRELAIRSAIGASRLRVVMQLLGDGLVLSTVGAAFGIGLAWLGIKAFNAAIVSAEPPFWIDIGLHPTVLFFVLAITVLAGVLSGIIPALQASGNRVNEVLKDESWGSSGLRVGKLSRGLVVAEIALSVGLLVAAGLMIKSITNLKNIEYRFATEDVFTARMGLFQSEYPDEESRRLFFDEALRRLQGLPGVQGATLSTSLPGVGSGGTWFAVEGQSYERDQDYPGARWVAVSPDYFETFGVAVSQGREFTTADGTEGMQVAIVNESFARRYFEDGEALGRRIRQGRSNSEQPWRTVVGVVPDMYLSGVEDGDDDPEGMYIPLQQTDASFLYMALRAETNPMNLANPARDAVAAVDRDVPLYWVQSLQTAIDGTTWYIRVFGTLFMIFGIVALFLASVGLYGVMSASVNNRTTEMGIRMALGAKARNVRGLVIRQGMIQMALGLVLGLGLATLLGRGLDIILYEVGAWDPATLILISAVLTAVGLLASYLPAARATRVEPMAALRYE
jgi:predicted permease